MEQWKKIAGYESYEVSSSGRVISHNYLGAGITKELVPSKCRGYLQVNLFKNGKQKCKRIHRLVAEAFIPNPNGFKEVNHIDGNKENNCVSNLEWCTRAQNLAHEHSTSLGNNAKAGLINCSIKKRRPIIAVNLESGEATEYVSIQEAGRQMGIQASNICACLRGRAKSYKGYAFIYK